MEIRIQQVGRKFRPQYRFLWVFWLNFYNFWEEAIEFSTLQECETRIEEDLNYSTKTVKTMKVRGW